MNIRHVRPGEPLAIDPKYLRQSRDAFFWLFAAPIQETEYREDGLAVVHVRGPLEHHEDPCSDSYDAIRARATEAFAHEDSRAVVLRIDSPGGVVSGLTATVEELRVQAKTSGKRFIAYVDEMATSAAYALACACDEIIVPPSAITGSIGVISTMVDVTAADEMMGLRFVTLTSGTRKADGHPHVPISDAAINAESRRVEKLAAQFFRLVRSSRGLSIDKIRGFQAGIFLGKEAVTVGIADAVMSWDECAALLCETSNPGVKAKPLAQPGTPEPSSTAPAQRGTHSEKPMPLSLDALIKRTEAALASEKDAKRKTELTAALGAYKKTKHSIEKHETEEGEEEDEDEEEGGNETDRSDDPDDDKDEDDEDEGEKKSTSGTSKKSSKKSAKKSEEAEAEDDGDEAEALAASVRRATGKRGAAAQGALAALVSKAKAADGLAERLARLETASALAKREALVQSALTANRLTKKEAAALIKKPLAHIEAFLEARPRGLVYSQLEELPVPQMQNPDGSSVLPPDLEQQLQHAIAASDGKVTREQILKEFAKTNATMNGAR